MSSHELVVIGIPTFRRPQSLERLLRSVARQKAHFSLHVLVADNEGQDGAGLGVVSELLKEGYPFPLTALAVPDRGISHVRNALYRFAFDGLSADAIAMVDDDEWVEPDWIAALVRAQHETSSDVVGGRILPEFSIPPSTWIGGLDIYFRHNPPAGVVPLIGNAGSVLINKTVFARWPDETFNLALSLTGGEDREFFLRLKDRGAKFAFAPDAVSHEYYGNSRMTRAWALRRAFQNGANHTRILVLHSTPPTAWLLEISKSAVALAVTPALIIMLCWSSRLSMRYGLTFARQLGKLYGLLGGNFLAYQETHGH